MEPRRIASLKTAARFSDAQERLGIELPFEFDGTVPDAELKKEYADLGVISEDEGQDYYTGDKELYVRALADGKDMFTSDGVMPDKGPETVLQVLAASNKALQSKKIDLSKTYTTEFVKAVK